LGFIGVEFEFVGVAGAGHGLNVGLAVDLTVLDPDRLFECLNLSINDFLGGFVDAICDPIWLEVSFEARIPKEITRRTIPE
jgi:hypothetical protein